MTFFPKIQEHLTKLCEKGERHLGLTRGVLFLLCICCLLVYCSLENWHISRDGLLYLRTAESSVTDYYLHFPEESIFPPLLIMLILHINHWLGFSCQTAGFMICILSGSLCPVIIFTCVYKLFRDYALALLSGILFFLIPGFRNIATDILRDAPSLCLNLAGICAFIYYRETDQNRYIWMCFFFFVAAFGFRYENLEFFLLIPSLNIFLDFFRKNLSGVSLIRKNVLTFLAGAAGVFSGGLLIWLLCLNCNYYSFERFAEILKRYLRVG